MKKKIGYLFLQIVPVMIGVYLGFVVTNWADSRKSNAKSETLIETILSEIEINQKRIAGVVKYHEMLRDSTRFYSNPNIELGKPAFFEGTRIMPLTSSAYNTGAQTGLINELPIDQIQSINELYSYQDSYNDFGNMLMSGLINKDFSENEEDMRRIARYLSLTMTDVVIKENELLEGFEYVKNMLRKDK